MKATDPVINIGIDARVLQIVKKKGPRGAPSLMHGTLLLACLGIHNYLSTPQNALVVVTEISRRTISFVVVILAILVYRAPANRKC